MSNVQRTKELVEVEFHLEVDGHRFVTLIPTRWCYKCGTECMDGSALERFELLVAQKLADAGVYSGNAFKLMRKALGLSATSLADLLDVTPETISRWETGKRAVNRCAFVVLRTLITDAVHGRSSTLEHLRTLSHP